jgi:hypothetical protein
VFRQPQRPKRRFVGNDGFACVKPRLAVQSTSPFKTKLVLLSSGAFTLLAISMR